MHLYNIFVDQHFDSNSLYNIFANFVSLDQVCLNLKKIVENTGKVQMVVKGYNIIDNIAIDAPSEPHLEVYVTSQGFIQHWLVYGGVDTSSNHLHILMQFNT